MTYGIASSDTERFLNKNVPGWDKPADSGATSYRIFVMVDGALDEVFDVNPDCEDAVFDSMVEWLQNTMDPLQDWQITLTHHDGSDVRSHSYNWDDQSEDMVES